MSDLQTAATASGSVTCTISSGPQIDLTEVLTAALAVNSSLTTASPIIMIAYGAAGGQGQMYETGGGKGGAGGQGGQAQMTTSIDTFRKAYNGSMLYFLFGSQGSSEHWGGKGGSSTVVSVVNLFMQGGNAANIVLCAGGGGGGSAASFIGHGWAGGNGGSATSALNKASSGAGQTGSYSTNDFFDTPANGGAGGANGAGGAGGTDNGKSYNIAGGAGSDGFGGVDIHLLDELSLHHQRLPRIAQYPSRSVGRSRRRRGMPRRKLSRRHARSKYDCGGRWWWWWVWRRRWWRRWCRAGRADGG
jgi:hypothetical protein